MSRRLLPLAAFLVLPNLAQAATLADCPASYSINQFVKDLNSAQAAVDAFDLDAMRAKMGEAHANLPCTQDRVHPRHLARFARLQALAAFLDQDDYTVGQWAHLARVGNLAWPQSMDETHPLRMAIESAEEPWVTGPEGAGIWPPKGGAILLDGELLMKAEAPTESPNFVQLFDEHGLVIESFWQDGTNFETRLLKADPLPPDVPKWWVPNDPNLDPSTEVTIDQAELARREQERQAAESAKATAAAQLAEAQSEYREKVKKKEERQDAKEAKVAAAKEKREAKRDSLADASSEPTDASVSTDIYSSWANVEETATAPPPPSEWVGFDFQSDLQAMSTLDSLERPQEMSRCEDLLALEPKSLMGKLKDDEIKCLEERLRHEPKMTTKDKVSRVLMADAWAKESPHRWEAAIRRHLTEIDRSDAELCYIFARYLAKQGPDRIDETLRWAEESLGNATREWDGDLLVTRVFALHRIETLAAQQKWFQAEQEFLDKSNRAMLDQASYWRNITKNMAREWLEFAKGSGQDEVTAYKVCVAAAGTKEFCQVG